MNISFFIDGFNLYHSLVEAEKDGYGQFKWLDLYSLCYDCKQVVAGSATLHQVHYFSAFAFHIESKKPGAVSRHQTWLSCLEDSGVIAHIGQFFKKKITAGCTDCYVRLSTHEEKETDVSIAVSVLEALATSTDIAIIISGDTDLLPAVEVARRLYPAKKVLFAFPYMRKNSQISRVCPGSFVLKPIRYANNQLPDPYPHSNGTSISKPVTW